MRPLGEISLALLRAAQELATPDKGPTLAELAAHAQVGYDAARATVPKMARHGRLRIVRTRAVAYRNKPVAEYEPAQVAADDEPAAGAGFVDLGQVISAAWR